MRKRLQTGVLLLVLVMMLFAASIASAESVKGTNLASGTDVNTGTEENTGTEKNTGTVLPILELHQVNLGSADGYVIRFDGTTVLIDGGEAWPNLPERIFPKYLEALGITHVDVLKFPHHGIREDSGDFVIGTAITKVLTPMYVLVPGSAAVWDIWSFTVAYSNEQRLTRDHIYTNKHGNILMFTDGADIVFRTEVDPADYAQYQVERALSE